VSKRLADKGIELVLTPEAKTLLIDKGFSQEFGARPLRREIERGLEDPLSEDILRGKFEAMNAVTVSVKNGVLVFEPEAKPKTKEKEKEQSKAKERS
jgi:ATP-dependent Clp protease ATP-binding subunit ClpC